MRILEVEYLGPPAVGGVEMLVRALFRHFTAAGHAVEVWATNLAGFDGTRLESGSACIEGVPVRRFPVIHVLPWLFDPHHLVWRGLRHALQEEARRGSIVHVHSFPSDQVLASLAAAKAGAPVFITPHHDVESLRRYLRLWRARVVTRRLIEIARKHPNLRLTVHTTLARDLWVNEVGWPPEQVRVIPNGVELAEFDNVTPEEIDDAGRLWPQGVSLRLLFVGRLAHSKGVDLLLQAVAQVPDAGLLVVGPDAGALQSLCQWRARLGLEGRTTFATLSRAQVCAAFRACDVFVLPSRYGENFGIAALEAMAAGKPVIASNRGGLPSLVEHGQTGLVVPAESDGALAEAIRALERSQALRQSFGTAGRKAAEQRYTWEKVARSYLEFFGLPLGGTEGDTPRESNSRW